MPRPAALLLALAGAACRARAAPLLNLNFSLPAMMTPPPAVAWTSPPPVAFTPPPGFASFTDYCLRGLATLSDAALDALYANASSTAGVDASSSHVAVPRGCVPGCIIPGHGSSVFAPVMGGSLWSGKCFRSDRGITNFASDAAPTATSHVHGSWAVGRSLSSSGGEAVRIRYPRGGLQSAGAAVMTFGYQLTGATDLADFKDEMRQLPSVPGLYLGYTFVVRGDEEEQRGSGSGGVATLAGEKQPRIALRFALAQTARGLEQAA